MRKCSVRPDLMVEEEGEVTPAIRQRLYVSRARPAWPMGASARDGAAVLRRRARGSSGATELQGTMVGFIAAGWGFHQRLGRATGSTCAIRESSISVEVMRAFEGEPEARKREDSLLIPRRPRRRRCRVVVASTGESAAPGGGGSGGEGADQVEYYRPKVDDIHLDNEKDQVESGHVRELPLFPLSMVLNPGGAAPLHIFEMRYRLLFNRIQDSDNTFGIIFYNKDNNLVGRVGCTALVTKYNLLEDGRLLTSNHGKQRFRVLRYLEEKPYVRAMVEFYDDDEPTEDLTDIEKEVWMGLQDVLRLSNKLYNGSHEFGEELRKIAPGGDSTLSELVRRRQFSFLVNQVLDMTVQDQQLLLQTKDTGFRLTKQKQLLDSARQYLAAQVTIKDALGS